MAIERFTMDVPYFMFLADFFIGKACLGSLSEARAMRLTVIVRRVRDSLPARRETRACRAPDLFRPPLLRTGAGCNNPAPVAGRRRRIRKFSPSRPAKNKSLSTAVHHSFRPDCCASQLQLCLRPPSEVIP